MMATIRRRFLVRLLMLADVCIFTASLLTALWGNSLGSAAGTFALSRVIHLQIQVLHFILILTAMLAWHVAFKAHRLYESRRLDDVYHEIKDVLKATAWGTSVCFVLGYAFKLPVVTPLFVLLFWLSSTALTLMLRFTLREVLVAFRRSGKNLRYVVIVGTNHKAYKFAHVLEEEKSLGYSITGYVDDIIYEKNDGINYLGALKDLPSLLKSTVIDEIIITLPVKSHYEDIQRIVQLAEEQGIRTRCLADIFETHRAPVPEGDGESESSTIAITGIQKEWQYVVKRTADILVASLLLIAASPVMLASALAIKATSPGPILFVQTRVGFNKRRFRLYKFRTMVADAERLLSQVEHMNEMDGPVFKICNDPRVTRLGRWLRKTSIDELPQLLNVLNGDMSLVGPRPLPERDYSGFNKDWQRKRFSVLPGITCIWQVSGRNDIAFEEWMKMDMEYIDKWTPLYDLKILFKTVPAVLRRKGAS